MAGIVSPTVRRRRLGHELRRLRELKHLTLDQASVQLEWSAAKLSRMETGRVGVRPRDLRDMLDLYGVVDGAHRELLLRLAREAQQKGWWNAWRDALGYLETFVGLEAEAAHIRSYQLAVVPGLLQTRDYAHAIQSVSAPLTGADELDKLVELRMKRQDILRRPDPPRYSVVLDEGVVRQQVGGSTLMLAQLSRLAEAAQGDAVIQILPFSHGIPPTLQTSFTIFDFEDPSDDSVVYVEHLTGALYLEEQEEIKLYHEAFDRLCAVALSPSSSVDFLQQVIHEIQKSQG